MLFNLACGFHAVETGRDQQVTPAPNAGDPDELTVLTIPLLVGIECRHPEQPLYRPRG